MWELDHKGGWSPNNWCFELWCWRRLLRVPWTARRSNTTVQKHQFFSSQLSLWSNSHIHIWLLENRSFDCSDTLVRTPGHGVTELPDWQSYGYTRRWSTPPSRGQWPLNLGHFQTSLVYLFIQPMVCTLHNKMIMVGIMFPEPYESFQWIIKPERVL